MARLTSLRPRLAVRSVRRIEPPKKTADSVYTSRPWRGLVASLIERRGRQCQDCRRRYGPDGKPVRLFGDHVHELRDGGALLDPANVRLLCGACHTTKTAAARAIRAGLPPETAAGPVPCPPGGRGG